MRLCTAWRDAGQGGIRCCEFIIYFEKNLFFYYITCMKNLFVFHFFGIFLLALPIIVRAEIGGIPFVPEEFRVEIYQYPDMRLIDNPVSHQLDTYYAFTNSQNDYQLRYSFFKQTKKDDPNIKLSFSVMILPIIWNVAGRQEFGIIDFNDEEVRMALNGDFGKTILIQNPVSDFSKGYSYILMNFFYKNNQGFIVQSILVNDRSFLTFQNPTFSNIFHSFRFLD